MDNFGFFSKDNILVLAADDTKNSKKGGGMLAILELLKVFASLDEKIKACADAQEITDNKNKVLSAGKRIEECFNDLLGMVKLRNEGQEMGQMGQTGVDSGLPSGASTPPETPAAPALPSTPSPI